MSKLGTSLKRRWKLSKLAREESGVLRSIAQAIEETCRAVESADERRRMDEIEAVRAELAASTEPMSRADFGAGMPNALRTAEEMARGATVETTVGQFCRDSCKPSLWCRLLFHLVRRLRPATCIEMGTAVGISGAYQAAALQLNGGGSLVTLEGDPATAAIARNTLDRLGLRSAEIVVGRFQETLPAVLASRRPDFVFVDGHHDERATIEYFDLLHKRLARPAVLAFDDITYSDGMVRAWRAISADPHVAGAVDLGPVGLCVCGDSPVKRRSYEFSL